MTASAPAISNQEGHLLTKELADFIRHAAGHGVYCFDIIRNPEGTLLIRSDEADMATYRLLDQEETQRFDECLTRLPYSAHGRIGILVIEDETWAVRIGRTKMLLGRIGAPRVEVVKA